MRACRATRCNSCYQQRKDRRNPGDWQVAHDVPKLRKQLDKFGGATKAHGVYEAGPTSYGLQRKRVAIGYSSDKLRPRRFRAGPETGSRPTGAIARNSAE